LENILVLSPIDFNEQKDIFNKLLNKIKSTSASLIIVDGMAMLYRLELGDAISSKENSQIKEVNKEVAKQMRILAEIARRQKIPVIITNQVYRQFVCSEDWMKGVKGESSFCGGDLF
jgi:RecA/RadA recombinase